MRKKFETMKLAFLSAALLCAIIAIASLGGNRVKNAFAQGFPFSICFVGVQPQCTTDFASPPISFTAQGGTTSTAGQAPSTVPIGSVAYSSFGNPTTDVAGTIFFASVYVPGDMTVTNINILNAGTVGTDKGIVALFNNVGTLIGNSALAGAVTVGANAFQAYALTTPLAIQGPGR